MKLIYIKNGDSTFLRVDQEILCNNFRTTVVTLDNSGRYTYFFQLLKLILILLFILPFRSAAFTRFADWHSAIMAFFCRIYGKKSIIVAGGYDASSFPEYGYGVYTRKRRGNWARFALRNATLVMPNNPSLIRNVNRYLPGVVREGGLDFFVPDRKGETHLVFNGYHTGHWTLPEDGKQENLVITVAYIGNRRTFEMKGIDDFINAASDMPDLEFRIIGSEKGLIEKLYGNLPGNIEIIRSLTKEELLKQYQRSKVFCLLSLSEGMPNVLCEAMLCGCIPVVSDVNYNSELTGDTGYIVKQKDRSLIREAIRKAIRSAAGQSIRASSMIRDNYTIDRRNDELVRLLNSL